MELTKTERIPPMNSGDRIRASGIGQFCPRQEALRHKLNVVKVRQIPANLNKIFAFGRVYERYFRDEVLGNRNIVVGKWRCKSCGDIPQLSPDGKPRYPKPMACRICGNKRRITEHDVIPNPEDLDFEFQEEDIFDDSSRIGGHNDGFLYWDFDYILLELKTTNDRRFKEAKSKGPYQDHLDQAYIYMKLHNYKRGVIWYFNKNTGDDYAFWITLDKDRVKVLFDRAYELRAYHDKGEMPNRVCPNHTCAQAKECCVVEACFAGD